MIARTVFVTGATGYLGGGLLPLLLARGHRVLALARSGSADRVPAGAEVVTGSALDEATYAATGLPATILRPWYVLGPDHRWPYALLPLYALAELIPATRDGARRLGLVTRAQMTRALAAAVESPTDGVRVLDVPAIRAA